MFVLEGGLYGRPSIQQYAHCPANEGNIPPEGLRLKGRLITHCSIALALAFQIDLYSIRISNFISTVLASALNLTPPGGPTHTIIRTLITPWCYIHPQIFLCTHIYVFFYEDIYICIFMFAFVFVCLFCICVYMFVLYLC